MPELPEVETVRSGLAPVLEGHRLARVEARRPDLRFPLPENFVQVLTGATVTRLARRAKYLLAALDREDTLVMHLGMSGRFEIANARKEGAERPGDFHYAADPDPKHAHIVFETETGARVTYYDPRRFGYMALVNTATLHLHPWFAGLGPEPLSDDFDADHLKAAFAGRKQGPKTLLVAHIRDVLTEAIAAGGSTLRDFAQTDGALGYFQHRFRAYDHEGRPCPNE